MQLSLAHLDTPLLEEITIDLWCRLFDAVGWPGSLEGSGEPTHASIFEALHREVLSEGLLLALETVRILGSEEGREAIVEAIADRGMGEAWMPPDVGARELAVELFLRQRGDPIAAEVFTRAQIRMHEVSGRAGYKDFVGRKAQAILQFEKKCHELEKRVLTLCEAKDLGRHVQIAGIEDDGKYVIHIIRSHRLKKPVAVLEGQLARASIQFRPVHDDIVFFDAISGRLRISARVASLAEDYRKLIGDVFFGSGEFFPTVSIYTLRPLQEQGRSVLNEHELLEVGRVRMTECTWERGDGRLHRIRASDCFQEIEDLNLPLEEGMLLEAKFKLQLVRKSTRPVTVTIRPPRDMRVTDRLYETVVDKYLDAIGVRDNEAVPARTGLWQTRPWRLPTADWREVFGARVDELVLKQVLIPVTLKSLRSMEEPEAGQILTPHEVREGDFYATSDFAGVRSRSVSQTDLDGLELDVKAFREQLRSDCILEGSTAPWEDNGLLDLGRLAIGERAVRVVYILAQPGRNLGDAVRALAQGDTAVLLAPPGHSLATDLPTVRSQSALPTAEELKRQVAVAIGITDQLPAVATAPQSARLVVDTKRGRVWADGVEITTLKPDTHPYKFVLAVCSAVSNPISGEELVGMLSPNRTDSNTSARQAKSLARRAISTAFAEQGRTVPNELHDPFPSSGSGGYRCSVPVYVA